MELYYSKYSNNLRHMHIYNLMVLFYKIAVWESSNRFYSNFE